MSPHRERTTGFRPLSRDALVIRLRLGQSGKQLLLAHEMPGIGQEERNPIKFETLFAADQTPAALVSAGIYSTVAVPLKGRVWREASMALLAREMTPTREGMCVFSSVGLSRHCVALV